MAPSIGLVYLVAETGKSWWSQRPHKRLKRGPEAYFFQYVKNWLVYFWMAPSIGIVCLVAETRKQVLTEPGAIKAIET